MKYILLIGILSIYMLNAGSGSMADLANSKVYAATYKKHEDDKKRKSDAKQKSAALTVRQKEVAAAISTEPHNFAAVLFENKESVKFVVDSIVLHEAQLKQHKEKAGCFSCCATPTIVCRQTFDSNGTVQLQPSTIDGDELAFYGYSSGKYIFTAPNKRCEQLAREYTPKQIAYIRMVHDSDIKSWLKNKDKKAIITDDDLQSELKKGGRPVIEISKEQRGIHAELPEKIRNLLEAQLAIDVTGKARSDSIDVTSSRAYAAVRHSMDNTEFQVAAATAAAKAMNATTRDNGCRSGSTHSIELGQVSTAGVRGSVGGPEVPMHRDSASSIDGADAKGKQQEALKGAATGAANAQRPASNSFEGVVATQYPETVGQSQGYASIPADLGQRGLLSADTGSRRESGAAADITVGGVPVGTGQLHLSSAAAAGAAIARERISVGEVTVRSSVDSRAEND